MSQDSRPPAIVGPLNIYGLLALAGIIGPVVFVISNLIVIFFTANYNLLRSTISSLAWSPLGWLQSIGFLVVGLMVEVFASGLLFSIQAKRGFSVGIGLLVYLGFGLLLIGAFQEDLAGTPHTIQGIIHVIAALSVFSSFPVASLLIALSLRKDLFWKGLYIYTIIATCLAVGFVAAHFGLIGNDDWLGLYEQVLVANMVVWVEVMAIQLLRLSFRPDARFRRPKIF
jgi:hypothetical protein